MLIIIPSLVLYLISALSVSLHGSSSREATSTSSKADRDILTPAYYGNLLMKSRMAIRVVYNIVLLVSLPTLNLGLLSDYKICGDAECESKFNISKQNSSQVFHTIQNADLYTSIQLVNMSLYFSFFNSGNGSICKAPLY